MAMAARACAQLALMLLALAVEAACETPAPLPPLAPPSRVRLPRMALQPAQRLKSSLELQLEDMIEAAYRRCFRTYEIAGKWLTLRIPFGQNEERPGSPGFVQRIFLGGKGDPEEIWQEVDSLLASSEFEQYVRRLEMPGEKVVAFYLERKGYSVFVDPGLAELLRRGPYPGTRTRVYLLKEDQEISETDVYNYLYCVGAVGMDCSGFIYYVQKAVAEFLGMDLDRELADVLGAPAEKVPQIVGLWLFNPEFSCSSRVSDIVEALRPGDVFLFRGRVPGRGLDYRHSAVIQSIDLSEGLIRYVQCTDWAPQEERGVHESYIHFDPQNPGVSLKAPNVAWTQEIHPTFPGEPGLRYWRNDGDRFRSYMQADGSLVVRLDLVSRLLESFDPGYYGSNESVESRKAGGAPLP